MSTELNTKKILVLTSDHGVEKPELLEPLSALRDAGAEVTHASPEGGDVQLMVNDVDKDDVVQADVAVDSVDAGDYDALVIPGGTVNADTLRTDAAAVALVNAFTEAGKPVAAICHGPWTLIEAGVLPGKTLTSFPSLQTDVKNAGGTWVDEQVFHCPSNDWDLITSRNPDDLKAFNAKIIAVVGAR